ncbi:MAG: serine/threonine protein kinase [Gallionellales bacterium GWA2_59_43]|nr:MAG: serine/threonine protein kinase [Gallionellales bacterium GWA2_59_43]
MPAQSIGRFEILGELGKGGQGTVYLAQDKQLDRRVAIKTLRNIGRQSEQLAQEARIVAKLQHPNIIPLFDAGEQQGAPYLVYAYIEGQTLEQLLKKEESLPLVQSAEIICGVLDGLAYAHAKGIAHLDIKPANIMIAANDTPMVMDFGLAKLTSQQAKAGGNALSGTPRYIAPEIIAGKQADAKADIYAVGIMLYEMVTGEVAVSGSNIYEVLNRAANEKIAAPSTHNEKIDEALESIILKAISKNPDERYADSEAMLLVLHAYLGELDENASQEKKNHSTLDFLLRRMRSKQDFPALSNIISEINKIVASDSESANKLASVILQDFALTNKLLKLVNAASYGQFGGSINTVSKAVVILGFETVRNIAMTLILLEFLQNKSQASQLKDEVIQSILSGMVAAQLMSEHDFRGAEEVMVCSMFHNLGRMLGIFYFFDESQEITRLVEQGESEDRAASKVLGMPYHELAIGVAHSWNFPARLIAGMRKLPPEKVRPAQGEIEQLTVTVNMAHELCEIAAYTDIKEKQRLLGDLSKRYESALKISERKLSTAMDASLSELSSRAGVLGIGIHHSLMLKRSRNWSGHAQPIEEKKTDKDLDGITNLDQTVTPTDEEKESDGVPRNPEAILGAGIQDVTTSLVGEFKLNDVLQMVLETMYRGMGFSRAMILIRDNQQGLMAARFGFGADVRNIIPRFRFSLQFVPDVFHLCIQKGVDIAIEDVNASNIADKIPEWYKNNINAPCFMLLPIMVKDKVIGLFYADMIEANSLKLSKQQLSLLRTLRNQAVLAIKQKT